jgi:hypothetical protein
MTRDNKRSIFVIFVYFYIIIQEESKKESEIALNAYVGCDKLHHMARHNKESTHLLRNEGYKKRKYRRAIA